MRLTLGRILLAAFCLCIAVLVFHVHRGDAARNARYARIATEIAGRPVEVRCPSFWRKLVDVAPNQGTVRVEQGRVSDVTDLSVEICDALDDVVAGTAGEALSCLPIPAERCRRRLDAVAFGIEALTHESYHLRGILDEARAECYALQSSTRTAMALGLTADEASALNTYYASALYPRLPSEYHSSDCRPGGTFDLHPETPAWPGG
jgi:hypothetical protein